MTEDVDARPEPARPEPGHQEPQPAPPTAPVLPQTAAVPGSTRAFPRPAALQVRGFRQLTLSWVFTNLGDSALYLMLAVWVKELTGSDGSAALVFALLGLPAILAPFIGDLADRVSRRRLLLIANLVMVPLLAGLLLVEDARGVWLVYGVTFAYGTVGYLTAAAQSGLVRDLLTDGELASGNALLATIDQALRLLSPLLGTGLYVLFGAHAVVLLTAGSFAATGVVLARLEVVETPPTPREQRGRYAAELVAGVRHLAHTPVLGPATVAIALGFGATGLLNVATFPVMEQGLEVAPSSLGVLVSVQGLGAVLGGLTAAAVIGRLGERRVIALGLTLLALGMLPLVSGSLALVLGGLLVLGFGIPLIVVAYVTLRQRLTPRTLQGRTSAAANVAINLPQTVVTIGAAAAIGLVDYRALILANVGVVVLAAAMTRPFRAEPVVRVDTT